MLQEMQIPNQPAPLAEFLEISIEALRKQMKRMNLVDGRFNRYAEMDNQTVQVLLEVYGQEDNAKTLSASLETDKEPTRQMDTLDVAPAKAPKTDKVRSGQLFKEADSCSKKRTSGLGLVRTDNMPKTDRPAIIHGNGQADKVPASPGAVIEPDKRTPISYAELSKDLLLALIAMVSMYVQMNHTAQVVGGEWLQAWAYALSIQFTGLAMTLYKGNLGYLRAFAVAEFAINLLHYRPWAHCELIEGVSVCGGFEEWTRSVLLSALIAFTIYSYVEIFAARRNEQTDKHG